MGISVTNSFETSNKSLCTFTSEWYFYFWMASFSKIKFPVKHHSPLLLFHGTFYCHFSVVFSRFNGILSLKVLMIFSLFNFQWRIFLFQCKCFFTCTFLRHFHFSMASSLSNEIPSKTCCFETLNQSLKIQLNFSHRSDFCEKLTWLKLTMMGKEQG